MSEQFQVTANAEEWRSLPADPYYEQYRRVTISGPPEGFRALFHVALLGGAYGRFERPMVGVPERRIEGMRRQINTASIQPLDETATVELSLQQLEVLGCAAQHVFSPDTPVPEGYDAFAENLTVRAQPILEALEQAESAAFAAGVLATATPPGVE